MLDPAIDEERCDILKAMTELRGQALHNEASREHFTKNDPIFYNHLCEIIQTGIEQGEFQEIDPEQTTELLLTTIDGAMARRAITDEPMDVQAVRNELDEYIRLRLLGE